MPNLRNITIEARAGEILQVWAEDANVFFRLGSTPTEEDMVMIDGRKMDAFLNVANPGDTVWSVMKKCTRGHSSAFRKEILSAFGLVQHKDTLLIEASQDTKLRLSLLKAILEGVSALALTHLSDIPNSVGAVTTAREFAEKYYEKAGKTPAFIVFDPGGSIGFSLVADRILEPSPEGEMEELLVDF